MKQHQPSPSKLACDAIGLPPEGVESTEEQSCCLCGTVIAIGAKYTIFTPPSSNFMDDFSMASRSGVTCGHCTATLPRNAMFKLQAGVFGPDGGFSLRKDTDRAWLLHHPPQTPFVAVVSDSTLQHLVWRTPVTYSSDLMTVRLGPRLLTIRRQLAMEMAEAVIEARANGQRAFRSLDREVKNLRHGTQPPGDQNELPPETQALLNRAAPGELWALATLAKANPPEPVEPDPIYAD